MTALEKLIKLASMNSAKPLRALANEAQEEYEIIRKEVRELDVAFKELEAKVKADNDSVL